MLPPHGQDMSPRSIADRETRAIMPHPLEHSTLRRRVVLAVPMGARLATTTTPAKEVRRDASEPADQNANDGERLERLQENVKTVHGHQRTDHV